MPIIYQYFGIVVYFYSREHLPIHVHCDYQDRSCKAEIVFEHGVVKEIIVKNVKGKKPLQEPQLTDFILVVQRNADDIVKKWNDYFVFRKIVKKKVIKRRYKRSV